jgi:uncharacterized membrane protein
MDHAVDRDNAMGGQRVRKVDPGRPVVWLERGWADLKRSAGPSLLYGAWAAAFGFALLLVAWRSAYLVPALVGGFLLVAPFVAIVFYALSQQIEQGRKVDGAEAVFAWRRNSESIALWGLVLMLALIFWERLAAIIFAQLFTGEVGDLRTLASEILFSGRHIPLLVVYFGAGALVAMTVFVFGLVTAPMLLDRDVDVVTAMLTSLKCCITSPGATLVWAVLIAVLTTIGFATLMVGLLIIFPLLGHASWHAYRDLVV